MKLYQEIKILLGKHIGNFHFGKKNLKSISSSIISDSCTVSQLKSGKRYDKVSGCHIDKK